MARTGLELALLCLCFGLATSLPAPDPEEPTRVSCTVSGSEWKICKICDPDYPEGCDHVPAEGCTCRDIYLNSTETLRFEGGGDCQSERAGKKWCYVDKSSSCDDKTKDTSDLKDVYPDKSADLYYSFQACDGVDEEAVEKHLEGLGNEAFMADVELAPSYDLYNSYVGKDYRARSPEECQATCLAFEKICFGWTFKDFDGDTGSCILKNSRVCCDQINKKIPSEGSISGFTCDNCKTGRCCWATSGRCQCNVDVKQSGPPQFCFSCDVADRTSGTVGFVMETRRCEFRRVLFDFVNGRWRRVRGKTNVKCDDQKTDA